MNKEMAYLIGMIIGNGQIADNGVSTKVVIDIPHKMLTTEKGHNIQVYAMASTVPIRNIIEPMLGCTVNVVDERNNTKLVFSKSSLDYCITEINKYVNYGSRHHTMDMNSNVFYLPYSEKVAFMRGIADVTGYIRYSNICFGQKNQHRVYIEIPYNWNTVIDIANLLKTMDIPVQNIDFAHPNMRDPKRIKYDEGQLNFWKKEHQIKIFANEFLPIGFNVIQKQEMLEDCAHKLLTDSAFAGKNPMPTHKFYWEKRRAPKSKEYHPGENDSSLPARIRGKHYECWQDIANDLGYKK